MVLRCLLLFLCAACALPTSIGTADPVGAPAATGSAGPVGEEHGDEVASADEECSVGVACGRATADGRPLLWKNRDAKVIDNVVSWFDDGRFPYVGLCNASSKATVWGGANAAGFCIMNSVSRDLSGDSKKGPGNGTFMKLALRRCETVADFEALLRETNTSGRRTRANFGVIDAHGGAALFETGHDRYVRFDAAKESGGIVLRTNFATTAKGDRGKERFARAQAICRDLPRQGRLDHRFLLQQFCRDLQPPPSAQRGEDGRQDVRETIHRQTTVAAMVFHGVKQGEDPHLCCMWTLLGQPMFSVAVPCWPHAGAVADELAGAPKSPLCSLSRELAATFYEPQAPAAEREEEREGGDAGQGAEGGQANDGKREKGDEEAETAPDLRWFLTEDLAAWRRELLAREDRVLAATAEQLARWRRSTTPVAAAALLEFHRQQAASALQSLRELAESRTMVGAGR